MDHKEKLPHLQALVVSGHGLIYHHGAVRIKLLVSSDYNYAIRGSLILRTSSLVLHASDTGGA